jgi:hypothetical protein
MHLEKVEERERKQKSNMGREREGHLHLEREDCMVPGGLVRGAWAGTYEYEITVFFFPDDS